MTGIRTTEAMRQGIINEPVAAAAYSAVRIESMTIVYHMYFTDI